MQAAIAAQWVLEMLHRDGCVYQNDAVGMLTTASAETLLRECRRKYGERWKVLSAFKKISTDAVWIKPDRYWRWQVNEDEPGREQRG